MRLGWEFTQSFQHIAKLLHQLTGLLLIQHPTGLQGHVSHLFSLIFKLQAVKDPDELKVLLNDWGPTHTGIGVLLTGIRDWGI